MKIDMSFLIDTMRELIETPSPVGYYVKMKPVIERYAAELGLSVCYDNRNTAYITLEGEDPSKTVCLSAHADTLGLMVRGFNADGTLRIRALGGVHFISCEGENVTVHTRDGREYTGMLICKQHSSHASPPRWRASTACFMTSRPSPRARSSGNNIKSYPNQARSRSAAGLIDIFTVLY